MRRLSFISLLLIYCTNIFPRAVNEGKDSTISFFPAKRVSPVIFLDPIECQTSGGSYFLSQKGKNVSLYSTVNLGFTKPIISYSGKSVSWELNFGTAIFTQFDLIKREDGSYLAGLINNDYKISVDYSLKKDKNILKFRIFHLSSHLGDDYIGRNQGNAANDKSENYEQADITYLRSNSNNYWYASAGEIYTKYVFRKRFSLQGGGLFNFAKPKPINYFTSINVKLLAENDFAPDLRAVYGVNFNRKSESLFRIWAEYYTGHLPYSTIDYGRVTWMGLGLSINL
jgi:hypothetical protein